MNVIVCFAVISEVSFAFTSWIGGAIEDLGDFNGRKYLSMPLDVFEQVPDQDPAIDFRVATADEKEALKACPRYKLINNEVVAKIRSKYSIDDELKAIRTADPEYNAFVAEAVVEGKTKKVALGW